MTSRTEPTLLDALALLAHVVDEVVVDTARDTHLAWVDRVHGLLDRRLGTAGASPGVGHRAIVRSVYAGVGMSLRGVGAGLEVAALTGVGPAMETGTRGRFVRSALNGLIGDRLERERPRLAISMAPRVEGCDVPLTADGLAAAYPTATGRVA